MRVDAATYGVGGVKERLPAAGLVPMNALEVLTWAEAMAEREAKRNRAAKEAKRKRTNFSFFVGTKGLLIEVAERYCQCYDSHACQVADSRE